MTHLKIIKIEEEHALVGIFAGAKHLCSVSIPKEDVPKGAKEGDEFSLRKKPKKS
jgi:hypothetical protein